MNVLHVNVSEALVLQPGDRALVSFHQPLDCAQIDEVREHLTERFPGTEFAIVPGVSSVTIARRAGSCFDHAVGLMSTDGVGPCLLPFGHAGAHRDERGAEWINRTELNSGSISAAT